MRTFSLRLWNSIKKEQSSRGRNRIQFSRAIFNRLHHKTIVIFLQLPASFTTHLLILTNKRSGSPIGKSLPYSTELIHPPNTLYLCALRQACFVKNMYDPSIGYSIEIHMCNRGKAKVQRYFLNCMLDFAVNEDSLNIGLFLLHCIGSCVRVCSNI